MRLIRWINQKSCSNIRYWLVWIDINVSNKEMDNIKRRILISDQTSLLYWLLLLRKWEGRWRKRRGRPTSQWHAFQTRCLLSVATPSALRQPDLTDWAQAAGTLTSNKAAVNPNMRPFSPHILTWSLVNVLYFSFFLPPSVVPGGWSSRKGGAWGVKCPEDGG